MSARCPTPRSFLVLAVLAAALALSACGYQLRGWDSGSAATPVAFTTVYLDNQSGDGDLDRDVRRAIRLGDGRIVDTSDEAEARLTLGKREQSHRVVTTNAQGQAIEYGVRYGFEYAYRIGAAFPLTASAVASGTYRYDPEQANASGKQRRLLERRLRNEAVQNMLRAVRLYRDRHKDVPPVKAQTTQSEAR